MLTNIKELNVRVKNSGASTWNIPKINNKEVWIEKINTCGCCGAIFEEHDNSKKCSNCGSQLISKEYLYFVPPKTVKKNGAQSVNANGENELVIYIEQSSYRFDIIRVKTKVSAKFIIENNPYMIPENQRIDKISYDLGLRAPFMTKLSDIKTEIEFLSCFSYDINKKPGERISLEVGEVGNFVEVNRNTLSDAFPEIKCKEIEYMTRVKTEWINKEILNASSNKTLKFTLAKFEEPSLNVELAVKHGLMVNEVKVKNPNATKLHEILGVSKAYLKFITTQNDNDNMLIRGLKTSHKSFLFDVYYAVGDRFKVFLDGMVKFEEGSELSPLNGYQTKEKLLRFFEIGYDMDRLFTYLTEDCVWQQGLTTNIALGELYDYVIMCEQLELRDYDRYPKALRTRHDVITMRYNSVKMNHTQTINFESVVNKYKKLNFGNNKYSLIIAKSPRELVYEGSELGHCVGSYASRMASEDSIIFFMRKSDDIDTPLVTVEVLRVGNAFDGYKLKLGDARGAFNRRVTPDEKRFLNAFKKDILDKAFVDAAGKVIIEKPNKTTDKERVKALLDNTETILIEDEVLKEAN